MAAELFKKILSSEPDASKWQVESAGTWAIQGMPAAQKAQLVLEDDFQINLRDHRSRGVRREVLRCFDLILTMEQGHKEALRAEFPEISKRVYLLAEMVHLEHDIRDPMGGSLIDFQDTSREINQILTQGLERIRMLAEENAQTRKSSQPGPNVSS